MNKDLELGKRIALLRKYKGFEQTQAASEIDIVFGTYQRYEYGYPPSRKNVDKILNYYKCSKSWLITGDGEPFPGTNIKLSAAGELKKERSAYGFKDTAPSDEFIFISQVRGKISAGGGLEPDAEFHMKVAFRKDWIFRKGSPENMSLIKVSGDSMEPTLLSGDLLLVDHSQTAVLPQGGLYAISIDHEIMIKRIHVLFTENKLKIISDNPRYEPIEADPDKVQINGKVIWFSRDIER